MEYAFSQKRNKLKDKYKDKKRYPYKVGGRRRIRIDSERNKTENKK
ncbi:hypothetical protein J4225_01565 [Candidatus Pacearchaeota archaeon]|nr:hypothetical protein [Candidatus Pacearchaeota archaeon]